MPINGYIPKSVTYFLKPKNEFKVRLSEDPEAEAEVTGYRPAFIADTSNKSMMKTGERFMTATGEKITRDNTPFRIKIVTAGNKIVSPFRERFKVVSEDNHMFDIEMFNMLDIIKGSNITNGVPDATFIWAKKDRDFVLLRLGSIVMQRFEEGTELKDKRPFKASELEIGDICEDTYYKNQHVYLGPVEIVVPTDNNRGWNVQNHNYDYVREKQYMFLNIYPPYDRKLALPADASVAQHMDVPGFRVYNIEFVKNINFKVKNGRKAVPLDLFERIRNSAMAELNERQAQYRNSNIRVQQESREPYYQKWLNVKPLNGPEPVLPEQYQVPIRR